MADVRENSSERIVAKIKAGHPECYEELWLNLEKFIRLRARDFAARTEMEDSIDDMVQESFLILPSAVAYYDEKHGKSFARVLASWFLPKAFCSACFGGRSLADLKEPLNNYVSLDTPIRANDESELMLLDVLADENAQSYFDQVEDGSYWISIGRYLRQGIEALKNDQERDLLQFMLNHGGCSYGEAHKENAIGSKSLERYRTVFNKARRNLLIWINGKGKEDAIKCGIVFDGSHPYYAGSFRSFKEHNNTSNVERIVLRNVSRADDY